MSSLRSDRHYGLDWLRIGAFGLLILYHVAMVFAPWDWVVKWPRTEPALVAPMALLTPWRLPLLFVVSGFATRRLLARARDLRGFVAGRSKRLLIPLAFGMAVLLPPEMWVRAREAGHSDGLIAYWLRDYWWPADGIGFPAWEHLWFVIYLWAYTIVLAGLVAAVGSDRVQAWIERIARGQRLWWMPVGGLAAAKLALMFVVPERQGLTSDWAGHAEYLPMLVFGFALGGSDVLWRAIARAWRKAAAMAAASAVIVVWVELAYQGHDMPGHAVMALDRAARLAMAWGVIVALLHAADTLWNRDHPWRATLVEAVFPAYLIHHPVLVVLAWDLRGLPIGAGAAFVFLLAMTAAACVTFYVVARDVVWLRPFAGLDRARAAPRASIGAAT